MNTIEITKIIVKNGIPKIYFDSIHEDHVKDTDNKKGGYLIHEHFQEALDAFKPHFAKLLDLREGDIIKKKMDEFHEEAFSNLTIEGLVFSGTGEDFTLSIMGTKTIRGSKTFSQSTPPERVYDKKSDYKFREELNECIQRIQYEAEEYLINQKHRIGQLSMDLQDHGADMEQ